MFRTVVCSDEAEEVLRGKIEDNEDLTLLYRRLEWALSRNPEIGRNLNYKDYDYWLYEPDRNNPDLPTLQAVYNIHKDKIVIEFLNVDYSG